MQRILLQGTSTRIVLHVLVDGYWMTLLWTILNDILVSGEPAIG